MSTDAAAAPREDDRLATRETLDGEGEETTQASADSDGEKLQEPHLDHALLLSVPAHAHALVEMLLQAGNMPRNA